MRHMIGGYRPAPPGSLSGHQGASRAAAIIIRAALIALEPSCHWTHA